MYQPASPPSREYIPSYCQVLRYHKKELSYKYSGINTNYKDISIPLYLTPMISKERSSLLFLSLLMIGINFTSYYVSYLSKLSISDSSIIFAYFTFSSNSAILISLAA